MRLNCRISYLKRPMPKASRDGWIFIQFFQKPTWTLILSVGVPKEAYLDPGIQLNKNAVLQPMNSLLGVCTLNDAIQAGSNVAKQRVKHLLHNMAVRLLRTLFRRRKCTCSVMRKIYDLTQSERLMKVLKGPLLRCQ